MLMTEELIQYIEQNREEAFDLLVQLAQIPAPSNHEEQRAAFCKEWLEKQGAEGVYIDEALNVVYPVMRAQDKPYVVYMAHSDVVFPDTQPLPLRVEDGKIFCPGIGDDTANVVALMMAAKYIAQNHLQLTDDNVLLVINAGEEGLGNLKGSRMIAKAFEGRIREFISFDGTCGSCVVKAVGSMRYRVAVRTEGGHSYANFGNRNAIAYLASLIDTLYNVKVPPMGKTTFNVGEIRGGTSVNTIAQYAEMLYEFRSDEREALLWMQKHFEAAVDFYRAKGIEVEVELLGERPCSGEVDEAAEQALMKRAADAALRWYGLEMVYRSGSTDCNIPLAAGIPAVCTGCYEGGGAHTREEWLEIASLLPGLKQAFEMILYHF